jgi:hypothetical protein
MVEGQLEETDQESFQNKLEVWLLPKILTWYLLRRPDVGLSSLLPTRIIPPFGDESDKHEN